MSDSIQRELGALQRMTTADLIERYEELHGEPCRTRHRAYLVRKVAWRIQANAEGDLTERARRRAAELANDADVRVMAPKAMVCPPQPGTSRTALRMVETKPPADPAPAAGRGGGGSDHGAGSAAHRGNHELDRSTPGGNRT